jgi:hypothetical protein
MVVSGTDLASTLSFLLLGLAVLGLILWIVIGRARKRGSQTIALDVALTLSGWWVMASVLGVVLVVLRAVSGSGVQIDASAMTMPWPAAVSCDETGEVSGAFLQCASAQPTTLTVQGASAGVQVLAAIAQTLTLSLWALPAVMIGVICFHTLRGRAFARTVTRSLIVGAVSVAGLGVLSELMSGITAAVALREVFDESSQWYPQTFQLGFSPVPLLIAAGLAALAAVFRHGMRMQQERDRLQRETEGLV